MLKPISFFFLLASLILISGCSTFQETRDSSQTIEEVTPIQPSVTKAVDETAVIEAEVAPSAPTEVATLPVVVAPPVVEDVQIIMKTTRGDLEITLFATKTPVTVANFLNLARRGYYDGLLFHRVIPNFMIQGGDPQGSGRGGPGYTFEDEIHPSLEHSSAGILSMANAGPGTNGSQFFITHNATPWLDGKHTVFGKVTRGQRVVDSVRKGDKILEIKILDEYEVLFKEQKNRLVAWDAILNAKGL